MLVSRPKHNNIYLLEENMANHLSREEQKAIKKRWLNQYKELEKMVNEWDPVGLISDGAPEDEYDCLSTQLLSLLQQGKQIDEIRTFIFKELDEHFAYKIACLQNTYHERYIQRLDSFCEKMLDWYKSYTLDAEN